MAMATAPLHRFRVPEAMQSDGHKPERSLGAWRLLGLLYLATSCGAYASEEMVKVGGGPLLCLVLLFVLPWVWGVPTALGVAELATSMPSNGGVLVWINCTFPASVTFTAAVCSMFMNVIDNAIYPHICIDYLFKVIGDQPVWVAHISKVAVTLASCVLNVLGAGAVGSASTVFMCLCLSPFVLLFCLGLPQLKPWRWLEHAPAKDVHWGPLLAMLTWNLSGFDSAGHVVEEISDPKVTFPKAVAGCLVLGTLTFAFPILVGASVDNNYDLWVDGYWSVIAGQVGGPWLQFVMGVGGCCSGFGLLITLTCTTSRSLSSSATMRIYPDLINRHFGALSAAGTPTHAIVFMSMLTMVFSVLLDFTELVAVSSFFYTARLTLVLIALPALRFRYPTLPRPYHLPFGPRILTATLLLPIAVCLLNVVTCAYLSYRTLVLGPLFVLVAFLVSLPYVHFLRPDGFQGVIVEDTASFSPDDEDPSGAVPVDCHAEEALGALLAAQVFGPVAQCTAA